MRPAEGTVESARSRRRSSWCFVGVVAANVIAIVFLEGFAPVLPDDPDSYTLIDQIRGPLIPSRRRRAPDGVRRLDLSHPEAAGSGRLAQRPDL